MTKAIKQLLYEAYRRNQNADSHERAKPLNQRWLGLGSASAYRPVLDAGLMRWAASVPVNRAAGWLSLTDEGVKVFESLSNEFEEAYKRMKEQYDKSPMSHFMLAGALHCTGD